MIADLMDYSYSPNFATSDHCLRFPVIELSNIINYQANYSRGPDDGILPIVSSRIPADSGPTDVTAFNVRTRVLQGRVGCVPHTPQLRNVECIPETLKFTIIYMYFDTSLDSGNLI